MSNMRIVSIKASMKPVDDGLYHRARQKYGACSVFVREHPHELNERDTLAVRRDKRGCATAEGVEHDVVRVTAGRDDPVEQFLEVSRSGIQSYCRSSLS